MSPKEKRDLDREFEDDIQKIRQESAYRSAPQRREERGYMTGPPPAAYRVKEQPAERPYQTERFTEAEERHMALGKARSLAAELAQQLARLDSALLSEGREFSMQGENAIMDIVPMIRNTEHELDAILDRYRLR